MWARKRKTGRVEHFWILPYPGQTDVWQPSCSANMHGRQSAIVKVRKADHDTFFVLSPSGAQKCLTCLKVLHHDENPTDWSINYPRGRNPWKQEAKGDGPEV